MSTGWNVVQQEWNEENVKDGKQLENNTQKKSKEYYYHLNGKKLWSSAFFYSQKNGKSSP